MSHTVAEHKTSQCIEGFQKEEEVEVIEVLQLCCIRNLAENCAFQTLKVTFNVRCIEPVYDIMVPYYTRFPSHISRGLHS